MTLILDLICLPQTCLILGRKTRIILMQFYMPAEIQLYLTNTVGSLNV